MTDHIPAEIVGAETESQEYQHRGGIRREYVTRITIAVNTYDLTRIDLTRPVTIHQEADTPTGPGVPTVGTVIESAADPRIAALPRGSILLDRDEEAMTKRPAGWSGLGSAPHPSERAANGPWKVLHIPKEADQ